MKLLTTIFNVFRSRPKTTIAGGSAAVAVVTSIMLATPLIQKSEGLRTSAYLDPVGIPTICFGETLGVKMGQKKTVDECHEILKPRLEGFIKDMRACTNIDLPAKTEAAFLSFTYNVGSGLYCKNIARKRINKGNLEEACKALSLYVKAGRPLRTLPGLVTRREEERALCLEGLKEGGLL